MPIENSEANVKLTTEQLIQIDIFEKRLGNLRNEIGTLSSQISALRNDNERMSKEKVYMEGIVKELEAKKAELEKGNESIKTQIENSQNDLANQLAEAQKIKSAQAETQSKLDSQKADLKAQQKLIDSDRKELDKKIAKFAEDKALLDSKYKVLSDAINSVK